MSGVLFASSPENAAATVKWHRSASAGSARFKKQSSPSHPQLVSVPAHAPCPSPTSKQVSPMAHPRHAMSCHCKNWRRPASNRAIRVSALTRPAELARALEVPDDARMRRGAERMVFPAPSAAYATTVMSSAFALVNTAFSSAIVLRRNDMSSTLAR